MVDTMSFMVRRGRGPAAALLFAICGAFGGALIGVVLVVLVWMTLPPPLLVVPMTVALIGALSDLGVLPRYSGRDVQVAQWVRERYPWWVSIPAYALALGTGVATRVPFAALFTLIALAMFLPPLVPIALFATYGVSRALTAAVIAFLSSEAGRARPAVLAMTRLQPLAAGLSATSQIALVILLWTVSST